MRVQELMDSLKKFPPDAEVVMLNEKPIGVCCIFYDKEEPLVYITDEEW